MSFNTASPLLQLWSQLPAPVLRLLHKATLRISPSPHSFNFSFTWGCSYLQLVVWELNKATVVQWWVKGRLGGSWSVLLISFTLGCHNLLYFLLFFFFSVAVLLIYQMVQMFWHNYFSLHYLFMMLFVIVFYTFGIINYVHVKISISKKSVTRGQKNSWFIFSQNLFPAYWIGWIFFKYVANHNAILLPPNNCVLFNNVLVA